VPEKFGKPPQTGIRIQTHAGSEHLSAHAHQVSLGALKWLAGERDFRDFSCLLPVKENRAHPADPAPVPEIAHFILLNHLPYEVQYVHRFR
jgi:hypothetical protein